MKFLSLLAIIFPLTVTCSALLAAGETPRVNPEASEEDGRVVIRFNGVIYPGSAKAVAELHELVARGIKSQIGGRKEPWLVMNSRGGSVTEAIAIGRWLRQLKGTVFVPFDAECFSSCVYVLASGSMRLPYGSVGIHRPFLTRSPTEDYSSSMRSVLTISRQFFFDMGVPEKLADDMFGVEPEQNKILSAEQLTQYRLNQIDVGLKEELALEDANRLGISRQEYNARRARYLKDFEACELLRPVEKMRQCAKQSALKHGLN